jgi:hypothetical protein
MSGSDIYYVARILFADDFEVSQRKQKRLGKVVRFEASTTADQYDLGKCVGLARIVSPGFALQRRFLHRQLYRATGKPRLISCGLCRALDLLLSEVRVQPHGYLEQLSVDLHFATKD